MSSRKPKVALLHNQPKADTPHYPGYNLVPADFTGKKELFQLLIFQREDYWDKEGKRKNWLLVLYGGSFDIFSGFYYIFKNLSNSHLP